jgi:hypothetical protein
MFERSITGQDFQVGILILAAIKSDADPKSVCLNGEIYGARKQKEIHIEAEEKSIED